MNPTPTEADWQRTARRLSEAFGAQFSVTVLTDFSGRAAGPIIQDLTVSKRRLVIPIGENGGDSAVAIATLDGHPKEVLERFLEVAVRYVRRSLRLDDQRLDLDACTQQISRDFEELNWLHRQLQYLRDCDTSDTAAVFAEGVLASLCKALSAEATVLVAADGPSGAEGQQIPLAGKPVMKVGPGRDVVDDGNFRQLVDRLREVAGRKPLVQNDMRRKREFSMAPWVHSCILVPVTRRRVFLGWLLAVNGVPPTDESAATSDGVDASVQEDAFGTSEARLMESAAAILALHPQRDELFSP